VGPGGPGSEPRTGRPGRFLHPGGEGLSAAGSGQIRGLDRRADGVGRPPLAAAQRNFQSRGVELPAPKTEIMISFLFWNLNRKPLQRTICRLAIRYQVDVFMFAELSFSPYELLVQLNRLDIKQRYFFSPIIGCEKIHIFTKFSHKYIKPIDENERLTIRHLQLPGLTDILVAINHFPSKLFMSSENQAQLCVPLIGDIQKAEEKVGHSRTILVGDLNMNPFEDGLVGAMGLHAVNSKNVATRNTRIVQGRTYQYFYNPMWGLFGDLSPGPPGTYYYAGAEPITLFWNIFDQVLIRPDLINAFDNSELMIITSDGEISFITPSGLPNGNFVSDHLPIYFKLNL